jgi:hypothetical protein
LFTGQPWFGRISSNKQGREKKKVTLTTEKGIASKLTEETVEVINLSRLMNVHPKLIKSPLGLTGAKNNFFPKFVTALLLSYGSV